MKHVDFDQVANCYARSSEDIPITLMDSLFIRNIIFDGKKVADIGSGTGALTRKMAMRKADVVGVEPAKESREKADAFNRIKNFTIPYKQGTAEATELEESKYDMITVMRAWHLFARDKTILEMKRILKENGILIVIDSGFLAGAPAVEKTFAVISKYVEHGLKSAESQLSINGFPVKWFEEWQINGFEIRDFYKLNNIVSFTKAEWLERVESFLLLASVEDTILQKVIQELSEGIHEQERYEIPLECNVCILKLL
ncbi:MAG TPA: class I SAM-dependent methyltransferase [Neobacillus sp.]|jgi:ubiquinone/menaquinone biosynthesis C-methylase UbiE